MTQPQSTYAETLAHYERVIAAFPSLERRGAKNPYTAINGNMSSYLHPRGEVALRLSAAAREAFLGQYRTTLFEAYGVIQKEYVTVPAALLADTEASALWFRESLAYVAALKPRPSKKAGT